MRKPVHPGALAIVALAASPGCADEFDPYVEVAGHRVLAVRASPPELLPGETATLDALVTSEAPSFSWSWCPLAFADAETGECPIEEEELQQMLQAAGSDAALPPYDLGAEPTARFEHGFPPAVLESVCEELRDAPLPEGAERPACGGRYEVTVRLAAASGEERIVAVRQIGLVYADDYQPNENPAIAGGRLGVPYFDLAAEEPVAVGRGFRYKLELDVPEAAAERYEEIEAGEPVSRRETLVVTWFREAGGMEEGRSSFLEGTTDFENLTTNYWVAPTEEEYARDRASLYFVLRDSRGGVDWMSADLELVE